MIGLFGGAFDPIHSAHLQVARDVADALTLTQVRFIPLNIAVHRDQPVASPQQRAEMIRLAIQTDPRLQLDTRELERQEKSYTLTSLTELRQELGDTPICLLVGGDAFNGFMTWHRPLQILELCHLVVMQRPGHQLATDQGLQQLVDQHRTRDKSELSQSPGGMIYFQPVCQMDVSSTEIRRRIALHQPGDVLDDLIPDAVASYIKQTGLYSS